MLTATDPTPTQRQLHLDHLERQRRLGLGAARGRAGQLAPAVEVPAAVALPDLVAALPSPEVPATPLPGPEPRPDGAPVSEAHHDRAAQARAIAILRRAGVPGEEMMAMLGLCRTTLHKRIREFPDIVSGHAMLSEAAAARAAAETAMIGRGRGIGLDVSQLATVLGVSETTVRTRMREAGMPMPHAQQVRVRTAPRAVGEEAVTAVLEGVAARHGVDVATLIGRSRARAAAAARGEAIARLHDAFRLSVTDIGRVLGGREHSSINYALKRQRRREWGE